MKFLKTDFGKVHAVTMTFALVNVLLALALKLGWIGGDLYFTAITAHVVCGFLILPSLLLLPLLFPTRTKIYRALRAKLFLSKRDLAQKNPALVAAKIVTMLMAMGFLSQTVTGMLYRFFQVYEVYPIHTAFIFVLPVLVLLHLAFMKLAYRRRTQPAK